MEKVRRLSIVDYLSYAIDDPDLMEQTMVSSAVLRQATQKELPPELINYHTELLHDLGFTNVAELIQIQPRTWMKALDRVQERIERLKPPVPAK